LTADDESTDQEAGVPGAGEQTRKVTVLNANRAAGLDRPAPPDGNRDAGIVAAVVPRQEPAR